MAAPILPTNRLEPLNLSYRILAVQFTSASFNIETHVYTNYTADIRVDEQPDYPDIPRSMWTVTISVQDNTGKVSAAVCPKYPPGPQQFVVSQPYALVYKVMWSKNDTMGILGDFKVGTKECTATSYTANLDGLAERHIGSCPKAHHIMRKDALVLVHLMFYATKSTARTDLKGLLVKGTLSDCKLICEGQEYPAHRAILAAQSPVFAAMFQNEMLEKSTGVCKIDGISKDVLQTLLQFAYTRDPIEAGMLEKLEELWSAADKYDMEDLRVKCEKVMMESINEDVAFKYLCFAREHKLKKLAIEAAKFIGKYPEETVGDF